MTGKILKKDDFNRFLYKIKSSSQLIAPVGEETVRFEEIKFISQINLKKLPAYSPKKFLFPPHQELFNFKDSKIHKIKDTKKKVIFGIRICDINAVYVLDKIFYNKDPYYTNIRDNITLIGLKCDKEIESTCFCTSMFSKNHFDLLFHDIGKAYYIEIGTPKGQKLVSRLKDYYYDPEPIKTNKTIDNFNIEKYYMNDSWEKSAKKCISCGICTSICPTCVCYETKEILDIDKKTGKNIRIQSSCQHDGFWKTNDDKTIKTSKIYRLKHRIYHKILYNKKKYGVSMCTGCGRCIKECPGKIDFVKIINGLNK